MIICTTGVCDGLTMLALQSLSVFLSYPLSLSFFFLSPFLISPLGLLFLPPFISPPIFLYLTVSVWLPFKPLSPHSLFPAQLFVAGSMRATATCMEEHQSAGGTRDVLQLAAALRPEARDSVPTGALRARPIRHVSEWVSGWVSGWLRGWLRGWVAH